MLGNTACSYCDLISSSSLDGDGDRGMNGDRQGDGDREDER
jgi:hypothetical protein